MKDIVIYQKWKAVTDKMYAENLSEDEATDHLIGLLDEYGVKLRSDIHKLLGKSYFVYDKDRYSDPAKEKPLGLGLIYLKPNNEETQDIFIISPEGELDRFYSEKEMVKKYPAMKGVHKEDLPIRAK